MKEFIPPIEIRVPIWRAAAFLALLCLFSGTVLAGGDDTRDPREHFFIQTFGDLPEELELARREDKKGILFFFEAEACPYCRFMLQNIFNQPEVQDWYRERFVNIAIDIHGDVELTDFDGITLPSKVFSDHRKVFLTPVVSFIDLEGAEIYRHLGMIKAPEDFLALGEYIDGGHHFYKEFSTFARERGLGEPEPARVTPGYETADKK
jgi:thioredoxin-related protein